MTFDVDIPGFKPQWRVEHAKEYSRQLTMHTLRGATRDERDESTASETVNEGQLPSAAPVP